MQKYESQAKLFAVEQRQLGLGWPEIKREITKRFGLEAPTTRTLQRWTKALRSRQGTEHALAEQVKKDSESVRKEVVTEMVSGFLPAMLNARDGGEDLEYIGWQYLLSTLEKYLGSEKFYRFVPQYLADRGYLVQRKECHELPSLPVRDKEDQNER